MHIRRDTNQIVEQRTQMTEKYTIECIACARFPMARIVVSRTLDDPLNRLKKRWTYKRLLRLQHQVMLPCKKASLSDRLCW
jgi:hypothetical protein